MIYIGQHKSHVFDPNYIGSGKLFKLAVNKYGKENFQSFMICAADSAEELNEKEIYYIDRYNSKDRSVGYNLADGGNFWSCGYHKGMLGKHQGDFQKESARKANSHPKSESTKEKLRKSLIGNSNAHGGVGMRFMHLGDLQIRVPQDRIDYYVGLGYSLGKSETVIKNLQDAYKKKYANGKYMHNGNKTIFVDNSQVQDRLDEGFVFGKSKSIYENRKKHI